MIRQVQVALRKAFHPSVVEGALSSNFVNRVTSVVKGAKIEPASNLVQDPRFALPRGQESQGFLYFFGPSMRKGLTAFGSLFLSVVNPNLIQATPNSTARRNFRMVGKELGKLWTDLQPHVYTSVKLNTESATIRVPLFICPDPAYNIMLAGLASFYTNAETPLTVQQVFPEGSPVSFEGIKRKAADLPNQAKAVFNTKSMLQLKHANPTLEIVRIASGNFLLVAEFELDKAVCQYMLNTPWVQIRPIDLHGPIYSWVAGRFGLINKPAKFSMPISKIAATLPKGGRSRLNEDGILVNHNGEVLSLPNEVDNINKYDSELGGALVKSDGSYCLRTTDGEISKMPPSQAVFIDWVNLKFAYTSVDGLLQIMSLDRCMPLNISHVRSILNLKLIDDEIQYFLSVINQLNVAMFSAPAIDLRNMLAEVSQAINESGTDLTTITDVTLIHAYEARFKSPTAAVVVKACNDLIALAKTNITNLYARYSVTTVAKVLAYATIFAKYAPNYSDVITKDNERRKAAINQRVDPDFKPESLPYLAKDRGLMPHQAKVTNLLKDSPDFAIIPVDAGGGKTMLCITDILKEMKSGAVKLALIMCPSHLVKDYVREFVYATDGRVNTIPITSYTLRKHSIDGLFNMIKSAPINSVVITDYNLANSSNKKIPVGYGTTTTRVFPIVDMLRRFHFDYVLMDESHLLKNVGLRQEAVNKLVSDIPKRRLASGTMVSDTIRDLPKQIGLLDPTIFGSPDKFIKDYALEMRGDKVISWKPGAEALIMKKIKEHIVVAGAKRKEWAAILPTPIENFHQADLTPKQQEVYGIILNEVTAAIQQELQQGNKKLLQLFSGQSEKTEEGDEEDEDDEPQDVNVDKLLKAHLARIEKYVTTPGSDPIGATMLSGDDLVSPKVRKIIEICQDHINSNTPGKILIFTNYKESAKVIFDMLPPDLKSKAIHYTAGMKVECGAQFEKDDSKRIMIGVEYSMNTGLNLQFASRLIRVETLWTPGNREQGDARIGRPNIKTKEARSEIYYDWVIANRTIDVTKISYLIAKTISKAKADYAGDPKYDELKTPELFPMTLDTIRETNDIGAALGNYFEAYNAYKQTLFRDYKAYKETHTDQVDENGRMKMIPLEPADYLPGSKMMSRVPYVPGTELYKAGDLGLVRYDDFMRQHDDVDEDDLEEDDNEEESEVETLDQKEKNKRDMAKISGMYVHTEFGDGEVLKLVGPQGMWVRLGDDTRVRVNRMATFFITRAQTNCKDMRILLMKEHGDIPLNEPITVRDLKAIIPVKNKQDKQEEAQDDTVNVELSITIVNDFLGLRMDNASENPEGARALEALGFRNPPAHVYALVKTPQHMFKLFKGWYDAGFNIPNENNESCKETYFRMLKMRKNAVSMVGVATQAALRNFYRMEFKANPDPMTVMPYPLIQDDQLYIALPLTGHPGTRKAISKVRVPGVTWMQTDPKDELAGFAPTVQKLDEVIKRIIARGINITNIKDLSKQRKRLRRATQTLEGLE